MEQVKVWDKTFTKSIPEAEILRRVRAVAEKLGKDLRDKDPVFLAVLNGSFVFASDLVRMLDFPLEVSFVKLASYQGTSTTGKVKHLIGINTDIKDRTVVVVEDIVESGITMQSMLRQLNALEPKEIHICTLLLKREKLQVPLDIEYVAMEIPNDFIVGYGLDYDQRGRNLRDIYTVVE